MKEQYTGVERLQNWFKANDPVATQAVKGRLLDWFKANDVPPVQGLQIMLELCGATVAQDYDEIMCHDWSLDAAAYILASALAAKD